LLPLLRERLFPSRADSPADVWIQAVSVGEVEIAATLAAELKSLDQTVSLLVSSTTPAGVALLPRRFGPSSGVAFRPSPIDLGFSVGRFFDVVRPRLLVLVETELWPRMLAQAGRRKVPVLVVNGRLSERSFRRMRLAGPLFRGALGALTHVAARTPEDAERFRAVGVDAARISVGGDLKLDRPVPPEPAFAARVAALAGGRPVVIFGSLAEAEIPVVLTARRRLLADGLDVFLLVAPRQPASFDEAFRRLGAEGLSVVRRTDPGDGPSRADAFLLDSIGELASAYRLGAAALLGGTFVEKGGHNVLEPLRAGLPVVLGPSVWSIQGAIDEAGDAILSARDGEEAGRRLASLLSDQEARLKAAEAARSLFTRNAGATARAASRILALRKGAA
jgi:3-deoxy-D-manno-octulosonic-acid transferase